MQFNEKMQGIGFQLVFFSKKEGIMKCILSSWVKRAIIVSNTCHRMNESIETKNNLHEGKEGGKSS